MKQANILMALMGMDIGGVETHVAVLCKHLSEMGYGVVVVSAGGVYEQELAELGVRHYTVNLKSKEPWVVARAVAQVRAIVKGESIDLIHAHARIPAFVCNLVSLMTGVPYITTAHTDFANSLILRLISCWGLKTIAISEDIQKYMDREFGISGQRQAMIVNGIDTGRFQPGLDTRSIKEELGFPAGTRSIFYISRLDYQMADVAEKVINAFEIVARTEPDVALIIAGGGNREKHVQARVEELNQGWGRPRILLLGRRTDIHLLLNAADLFIGVSRAAMEAMACEVPVILAGLWQYPGPLEPAVVPRLAGDNFTGRSFETKLDSAELARDIKETLAWTPEKKQENGRFCRAYVIDHYSSRLMAEKTAEVYEEILKGSVISCASSTKKGDSSKKLTSLICWLWCWSWLQSVEASISMFL